MNAFFRLVLPAVLACGLAACASGAGLAQGGVAPSPGTMVKDDAYVTRVERIAGRRNIRVHWVHPPLRRVER